MTKLWPLILLLIALAYFLLRDKQTTEDYGTKVNTVEEQRRMNGEL